MDIEPSSHTEGSERVGFQRRLWMLRLNLVAGVIGFGILILSVHGIWNERQEAWERAQRASRNLLTTLARDLGSHLRSVDVALIRITRGLRYQGFTSLPPEVQHGILFDQAGSASIARTILLLNASGDLVADGGPLLAPRGLNVSDADFFKIHKERSFAGLFLSHPYESQIKLGTLSIALSRRLSKPDGEFAGVAVAEIALSDIYERFQNLNIGPGGSITLFRDDGTILMRLPYDREDIGRKLSDTANFQRFREKDSGSFEGIAAIDRIRRLYTFSRVDDLSLILTVSLSVDEILAPWWRRTMVLAVITGVLCAAVMRLMFLFRRELGRRTRAEKALERLSAMDPLTGLPNRRTLDKILRRELQQAIRSGSPLSLLFVDVDCFKGYNDEYGHAKGDDVLRAVADAIDAPSQRSGGIAARYGGEEFIVVLPEIGQTDAGVVAQTIRKAVAGLGIEHRRSAFNIVTVSIGAATASPAREDDAIRLLKAADAALYEAKAAGRNRVFGPGGENGASAT
ncbi:sensor domain-containing diguanylate cyclase [Microvirga makkahensis]|uniref:diguanylate cyclase n=1 Tax=Microvirga makkahensis TaxID=1128670 RepID=A0A7X3MP47_9HYPH|nr:sensor domain-containing diguanylate cyclase [Microvirga makkahensis]MXQ10590.1 diguanylate cyclase [Microvirga makkahensis]